MFRYGRRKYGFGKIMIDIVKRRKTNEFEEKKHYGLDNLMGSALIVKIYHKLSDTPNIDTKELENCSTFPHMPLMDNKIYYNEYKIIGNSPITNMELNDTVIFCGQSIDHTNLNVAYLQYGLIYKEISIEGYKKHWENYRDQGISFDLHIDNFEKCVELNSNQPYYESYVYDLRKPENNKDKEEIFKLFGLDANLDYEGNVQLN